MLIAWASSGKSSRCADGWAAGRGVLLVGLFGGDGLRELLDEVLEDEDFRDVSVDECLPFLLLPFCFLFFGLLFFFFCTFEAVAFGLVVVVVAAGRFGVFAFSALPLAAFVGGAGVTAGTLPALEEALERVVGAMLLSCLFEMKMAE